ncbi:MAG: hypothetical protein ACUVTH_03265, partial [Thermogutta sp.]
SQIPLFSIAVIGLLPWGSNGYDKSKNPVSNHDFVTPYELVPIGYCKHKRGLKPADHKLP